MSACGVRRLGALLRQARSLALLRCMSGRVCCSTGGDAAGAAVVRMWSSAAEYIIGVAARCMASVPARGVAAGSYQLAVQSKDRQRSRS